MPTKSFNLILQKKISSFKKEIKVDSDKSISIRSMLIGAISENISSALVSMSALVGLCW